MIISCRVEWQTNYTIDRLIKNVVVSNFKELNFGSVFVKSSTGFYITENGLPNGTIPSLFWC
jgi:deoxyribose-phosphate aldolase